MCSILIPVISRDHIKYQYIIAKIIQPKLQCGKSTDQPWKSPFVIVETNLPTPMTARVYVKWPDTGDFPISMPSSGRLPRPRHSMLRLQEKLRRMGRFLWRAQPQPLQATWNHWVTAAGGKYWSDLVGICGSNGRSSTATLWSFVKGWVELGLPWAVLFFQGNIQETSGCLFFWIAGNSSSPTLQGPSKLPWRLMLDVRFVRSARVQQMSPANRMPFVDAGIGQSWCP